MIRPAARALVAPLRDRSNFPRLVFLLLGSALALAFAMLDITVLVSVPLDRVWLPLAALVPLAVIGLPPVAVSLIPAVRVVEGSAVRSLVYPALPQNLRPARDWEPDEIAQAVRTVARGDSLLFPAAIRALGASALAGNPAGDGLRSAKLTEREADVLRLMARGLSNAEIATELYVSQETVKTHVGNLLSKLTARHRTQAVIAAYESGFIRPSRD